MKRATVADVIRYLQMAPKDIPVVVQDGLDPSDWAFATEFKIEKISIPGETEIPITCVVIS